MLLLEAVWNILVQTIFHSAAFQVLLAVLSVYISVRCVLYVYVYCGYVHMSIY